MIEWTAERLLTAVQACDLPPLCNVTLRIAERPVFVRQPGARWEVAMETPTGGPPILVAVHSNPVPSFCGYSTTSEDLLRIFDDSQLRGLITAGETATVQAVPRFSESRQALYLNVEAVFLLRPWRTFGRRQVDFSSGCARKHYLSVAKGARARHDVAEPQSWQSLAGMIAHDLIEAAALDPRPDRWATAGFAAAALSPETAVGLLALGMAEESALISALVRGTGALSVLRGSAELTALLESGGPWQRESDLLDRGVTLTPDLIGDRIIIEIKQRAGAQGAEYAVEQVEAYLAWAMVTYGIGHVVANWRAIVANLHSGIAEADRLIEVRAERSAIGRRVFQRHRLLALADGAWLPPPVEGECTRCAFHRGGGIASLPPACQYYCQTERSWPCEATDGRQECPLYGACDEHRRWQPYERLDLFNRLRRDLLVEEEEAELAAAFVASRINGGWGPFYLGNASSTEVRLMPGDDLARIEAAVPGQVFRLLSDDRPLGLVRFRRLRRGEWVCIPVGRLAALHHDAHFRLVPQGVSIFPARAQLSNLDLLQRLGDWPGVLRATGTRRVTARRYDVETLAAVSPETSCVVVDCQTPVEQVEVLAQALDEGGATPMLILTGPSTDLSALPRGTEVLDEFAAAEALAGGDARTALLNAARRLRGAGAIALPWDLLFGGVLDRFRAKTEAERHFTDVAVLDAHALPMLTLHRCFELARRRVLLLGSSLAAGPATEAVESAASPLFQNLVQAVVESDGHMLPEIVRAFAVIRHPIRLAAGLEVLREAAGRRLERVPAAVHVIDAPGAIPRPWMEIRIQIPLSSPEVKRFRIQLSALPSRPLAARTARTLLRALAPIRVEEFCASGVRAGQTDSRLLGWPVRIDEVVPGLVGAEHGVVLRIPEDGAPHALREGLGNAAEAEFVAEFVAADPYGSYVATSPFSAQCRLLAQAAGVRALANFRIVVPERLGQKIFSTPPHLLVSLAAADPERVESWPFTDVRTLLNLLGGPWQAIHIFCTRPMSEHPVVRLIHGQQ